MDIDLSALKMLLVAIIFLSVLIEIKSGGTGIGAALGLIAAAVFFGSGYIKGLVSIYHIALFLGGILFIIIEIAVPTIGLFAALGVIMMLYSIILALGGDLNAVYMLVGSLILSVVFFALIVKKLPSSRLWQKIILKDSSTKEKGYISSFDTSSLLDKEGIVFTELRPAGTVLIDNSPVDAVSEGTFIEKGKKIKIVKTEGSRIIVRELK